MGIWLLRGICVGLTLGLIGCSNAPTPAPASRSLPKVVALTDTFELSRTATSVPPATTSPTVTPTAGPTINPNKETDISGDELRYLALGDSYTIGHNVDGSERWPVQLVQRLRAININIAEPQIVARTGWTTEDLAVGIEVGRPVGSFDIVTLLIGVNNQYQRLDINQYQQEFAELLERAVEFAGHRPSHVIVVSISDWGVTPFASGLDKARIAKEIDQFNIFNREETARVGANYIDVTGISREAETKPNLLAADGLHPSGRMYSRWVDLILPSALGISTSARQNGP